MKEEEKIGLSEAIKRHYKTEPLNIHLPAAAANRVFGKKTSLAADAWLYVLAAVCGLGILVVCIWALRQWDSLPALMGVGLAVAAFLWLSYKEMNVLQSMQILE